VGGRPIMGIADVVHGHPAPREFRPGEPRLVRGPIAVVGRPGAEDRERESAGRQEEDGEEGEAQEAAEHGGILLGRTSLAQRKQSALSSGPWPRCTFGTSLKTFTGRFRRSRRTRSGL